MIRTFEPARGLFQISNDYMSRLQSCIFPAVAAFVAWNAIFFLVSARLLQPSDRRFNVLTDQQDSHQMTRSSKPTSTRRVQFMTLQSMIDESAGRFTYHGAYSGMYWVSLRTFARINATAIQYLEEASHLPMQMVGNANVIMTKDWLDMAVEHLSRFHRLIHVSGMTASRYYFDKLVGVQKSFLHQVELPKEAQNSAFSETIALIPVFAGVNQTDPVDLSVAIDESLLLSRAQMVDGLASLALASTMASLWQAGMGRVVAAGNTLTAPWTVQAALEMLSDMAVRYNVSPLDVQYACAYDKSTYPDPNAALTDRLLVPADAIHRLQQALSGKLSPLEQTRWIGARPDKYNFVYYTEPDLILHTRPSAIGALSNKLQLGKLVAAHRFQPLPHEDSFADNPIPRKVVPRLKADMMDLNRTTDSCCDAGNHWPGVTDYNKCGNQWHDCGLSNRKGTLTDEESIKQHERLKPYPRIRLLGGTHNFVVSSHGRLCQPKQSGSCD